MSLEALNSLINNIPDWQAKLDELSGQVNERQVELAEANRNKEPETRSLRNKGSQEALKPKDDGPIYTGFPENAPTLKPNIAATPFKMAGQRRPTLLNQIIKKPPAIFKSSADTKRISSNRVGEKKKKKKKKTSICSADGPRQRCRTRNTSLVYYDSYTQGVFDELVKFVSSSRNLMRRAKMAAKVAQIKKLADMEVANDENVGGDKAAEALSSLQHISSRRYEPAATRLSHPGLSNRTLDVYDELEKALEFVQSTCEHGAHQLLRDAKCSEEVQKIQKRIGEISVIAQEEMKRVQREGPEMLKETADAKPRVPKSIAVSGTMISPNNEAAGMQTGGDRIEVDSNSGQDDFDSKAVPARIRYNLTMQMRMRAVVR
ncbi:hypothetical protein GGI42DRAFT_337787 [Trichoderma sp. SZMC 28013]